MSPLTPDDIAGRSTVQYKSIVLRVGHIYALTFFGPDGKVTGPVSYSMRMSTPTGAILSAESHDHEILIHRTNY